MITGELRSRIDKLWIDFWTGGITNPLTVIDEIQVAIARCEDFAYETTLAGRGYLKLIERLQRAFKCFPNQNVKRISPGPRGREYS